MTYRLSLLDKSPVPAGATATEALAQTVLRAQRAEALGYHRYWLAEHHGNPGLAGSAPEVLAAWVLNATRTIRVGTGGVMLQHYSPFKVAEVFGVLASLAPGRVDLGIGKAPGGLPTATRALQAFHDKASKPDFAALLAELDGFITKGLPDTHPLAGSVAYPEPAVRSQKILLGGSVESAELAGRLGWQFAYAGHFNGDPATISASIAAYRAITGTTPLLALHAFAADNDAAARQLVGELRVFTAHLPSGQRVNLPTRDAALEFARQAGASDVRIEEKHPHVIAGSAERVRAELDDLARRYGIAEFVIDTPVAGFAERFRSLELLATAANRQAA
jgi:luciferase family oxidoreductase group 1